MHGTQIAAIALIAGGALALAFGGLAYMNETQVSRVGPVALTVTGRQPVNVPVWGGAAAIIAGVFLVMRAKRNSG